MIASYVTPAPCSPFSRLKLQSTYMRPMSLFTFHFIVSPCFTINNSSGLLSSSLSLSLAVKLLSPSFQFSIFQF